MVWMGPDNRMTGAPPVVADGLFATTPLATPDGWCPAGALSPGDPVLTFDGGIQPVTALYTAPFHEGPLALWPLRVPVGALDNRDEITLLPQQKLLLECDLAEDLFGDPFALIPAEALEHWRGIARFRPGPAEEIVQLRFDRPQIVYASRGVLLSCAGEGWAGEEWPEENWPEVNWPEADWSLSDPGHTVCTLTQARHLVACLMAEEAGAALRVGLRRLEM